MKAFSLRSGPKGRGEGAGARGEGDWGEGAEEGPADNPRGYSHER